MTILKLTALTAIEILQYCKHKFFSPLHLGQNYYSNRTKALEDLYQLQFSSKKRAPLAFYRFSGCFVYVIRSADRRVRQNFRARKPLNLFVCKLFIKNFHYLRFLILFAAHSLYIVVDKPFVVGLSTFSFVADGFPDLPGIFGKGHMPDTGANRRDSNERGITGVTWVA